MKISVKFLTIHLATCLFMAVPFAKAQPSPSACVQQCEAFCAAVVANFNLNGGAGPLSGQTVQNFQNALPRSQPQSSQMLQLATFLSFFQTDKLSVMITMQNLNFLAPLLANCQSTTYCSQGCDPSAAKSRAQKPNVPPNKAAPSQ